MAKLPRSGVAYQCLYERDVTLGEIDVTLAEIVANLGLKPLSNKAEREIRDRLGFAWQSGTSRMLHFKSRISLVH